MAQTMRHVGKSYTGLTNRELAAGKGEFVSDVILPNMAHMAVLRSPHAAARIVSIDTSAAEALEGVVYVMTGAEAKASMRPIPEAWNTKEIGAKGVDWYALVPERVRYVGEAVAAVVAEAKHVAYEALGLIDVQYEVLTPVTDVRSAIEDDSPLVEPDWGDNSLITRDWRTGDMEAAFEATEMMIEGEVRSERITGVSIEPRGSVASYDAYRDKLTLWESTQNPHPLRTFLAETLEIPERSIQVIQPRVGGAFGLKQPPFQEQPLIAYLARKLERPIKWIEERYENFATTGHSRDVIFNYRAAFDREGIVSGLDIEVLADVGAPTALLGWGQSFVTAYCLPTVYRVPNNRIRLNVVVTNKTPWNAYRGFGKDSATFLMERIMDRVARELRMDRAEVRFRNFIQPDEFPYSQPSGAMLDSGDYPGSLEKVLAMVGWEDFDELQRRALDEGRRIGIGLSHELTPEGCAMPGAVLISAYDSATVRVSPSGDVTVLTGVTSPGCGNETAMAQIAAEFLGCEIDQVAVIQGDTDSCPYGLGNFSSRATMYGGSAVQIAATELREKMFRIAGKMLEAAPEDLDAGDGKIFVKGAESRNVAFTDVANQVYRHTFGEFAEDEEPGLESTRFFRMGNVYHQPEKQGRFSNYPAWPSGSAACIVEVDPDTGKVDVLRFCLVDDAGRIINPLLVTANLHGSLAQGIGGAMYERLAYDDNGQLLTVTLMDYTIPTAVELPRFEVEHQETHSPFTPLGMKGVGESGIGVCLNALCSAIESAFPELDLEIDSLTLTPSNVWRAIHEARRVDGAAA